MNRPHRAIVLSTLLAATAVAQVDRGRTPKTPAADAGGVQRASCVLQIDTDPNRGSRSFDSQTLNALLTSTTLVDPAAKKALNLGPVEWQKVAQIELTPAGNSAVRLGVTIVPDGKLPDTAAQAFLDALATSAKTAVEQIGGTQLKAAADRIAALEADVAAAQARLKEADATLASAKPVVTYSLPDYDSRNTGRNTVAERNALEITLVGQRARLKALDAEMARLQPTTRPVVGGPSAGDAVPISRFDSAGPGVSGLGVYDRFEVERVGLRCNIAESQARLDFLTERAAPATAPATQPTPVDYQRAQSEQNQARNTLDRAQNQLDQARRERQSIGTIRLLILDGRRAAE